MSYTSAVESSGQFSQDAAVSNTPTAPIPAAAGIAAATHAAASKGAIDAIANDSANVSLAGAMLSQASTGSDVRFDKVAALQQSIQAGTYGVSSANVASKLIDALIS